MTIKQKLLSVLDVCIADINEETLLQILLDLYEQRKKRIQELESENAQERQSLHDERESMHRELDRARRDPLYFNNARNYYFINGNEKIIIQANSGKLQVLKRQGLYDSLYNEVSEKDFFKI